MIKQNIKVTLVADVIGLHNNCFIFTNLSTTVCCCFSTKRTFSTTIYRFLGVWYITRSKTILYFLMYVMNKNTLPLPVSSNKVIMFNWPFSLFLIYYSLLRPCSSLHHQPSSPTIFPNLPPSPHTLPYYYFVSSILLLTTINFYTSIKSHIAPNLPNSLPFYNSLLPPPNACINYLSKQLVK